MAASFNGKSHPSKERKNKKQLRVINEKRGSPIDITNTPTGGYNNYTQTYLHKLYKRSVIIQVSANVFPKITVHVWCLKDVLQVNTEEDSVAALFG